MMLRAISRLVIPICVVALTLIGATTTCRAYNRDVAMQYGIYWGEDPSNPENDRINPIYQYFPADCANFISQCVIAGGVRFRSTNWGVFNDNTFNPGFDVPELETGKGTTWINSSDLKQYSRTIGGADQLPRSMKHRRHSFGLAKEYCTSSQLSDSDTDLWNNLRPGDLCFQGGPSHYFHCMLISTVVKTSPYDIKICGHNHPRSDVPLSSIDSGWKSGAYSIVRTPDAPELINQQFWSGWGSGAKPVSFLWVIKRVDPGSGSTRVVGPQDLVIKLTFDCDMNVSTTPDVHIRLNGHNYAAVPLTDSGLNQHGWWTASTSGDFMQNKTWKGVIYGSDTQGQNNKLPAGLNGIGRLWIRAQGRDGSWNDCDNVLSKYDPDTGMRLIGLNIDTRKGKSEKGK